MQLAADGSWFDPEGRVTGRTEEKREKRISCTDQQKSKENVRSIKNMRSIYLI